MKLSFQKMFFALGALFLIFATMILAKSVLMPLSFALLLSFILFPVTQRLESWGFSKILAAFSAILLMFLLIFGGISLFSTQIMGLMEESEAFQEKLLGVFTDVTLYVNNNINFIDNLEKDDLYDQLKGWLTDSAGSVAANTFSGTTAFFSGLVITVIFTFLILIYREGLTRAFAHFYPQQDRGRAVGMFRRIQQVGKQYLSGMVLIVLILGVVNSIGLMIIGISNPFLFGFLAATLAIVPYVGTTTGAAIPVLYAFMAYDSLWMPAAIAIMFWGVQLVESNFLSPKIVGGSLSINALAALLSIIIGASVWGVAGMILFLPFAAILKVVCQEYEALKPVALLIGERNYEEKEDKGPSIWARGWEKIKGWTAKRD